MKRQNVCQLLYKCFYKNARVLILLQIIDKLIYSITERPYVRGTKALLIAFTLLPNVITKNLDKPPPERMLIWHCALQFCEH